MPRQVSPSRLEAYRKQQVEIAKKIKQAEALKREKAKGDARRKHELAGKLALHEFERDPRGQFAQAMLALLNHGLARPADRALFNLPPLPKEPKPEPAPEPFLMADGGGSSVGGG